MTRAERLAAALAGAQPMGQGEIGAGSASLMTPVSKVVVTPPPRFEPMDGGPSPIKARVLGWCRHYVACGVRIGELADYFDLDADDLGFALNGAVAR